MEQTDVARRDARLIVLALLAVAFGVWALVALAPLSVGTMTAVGPAMVPTAIAAGLVVVGGVLLAGHVSGAALAPPRLLPRGWRWAVLASLTLSLVLAAAAELFLVLGSAPDLLADTVLIFVGRPALVVLCLVVLTATARGVATGRRADLLALLALAFPLWELGALAQQPEIALLVRDVPVLGRLADRIGRLGLNLGPADILALAGLRWTLAIALGVVLMGTGLRTGIVSLLVGALAGLGGIHVASGEHRLFDLEALRDDSPYAFELAAAVVIVLITLARVNPLPAYIAFASAPVVEEQFQSAMMLSRGDLVHVATARPVASTALLAIAVIVMALASYRWPWRSQ
jgi:hypothetical protein